MKHLLARSLNGIRVLDLSRVLAGPWAAQTLADLGAEVIKVEHPRQPDETRAWGPPFWNEISTYYLSCNRGKRAVALDLKHPEGRQVLDRLVAASDILIENFRTSSLAELGLTPERLHAINPKLVICSISGFGRSGPLADVPGYDFVIQGLSGMMAKNGDRNGSPTKFGVAIADLLTGQSVTIAALAGLRFQSETGKGLHADIALLDCATAGMANVVQAFLATGNEPKRQGNEHMQIVPYQAFQASDGWIIVAVGNDRQWRAFCHAIGRIDLAANDMLATNSGRVQQRESLTKDLVEHFSKNATKHWLGLLQDAQVPCGPVQDFSSLFASDVAQQRGYRTTYRDTAGREVDLMSSPIVGNAMEKRFPPQLGEHTDEILAAVAGMTPAEIHKLRQSNIVK